MQTVQLNIHKNNTLFVSGLVVGGHYSFLGLISQ
jgi:hypothetical protein